MRLSTLPPLQPLIGRTVLRWHAIDEWPGREHCVIEPDGQGFVVRSALVGENDDTPFGVFYELSIDGGWRVRTARFLGADGRKLVLEHDGEGRWRDGSGAPLAQLDGCIDLDISRTPLTNTLPLRRMAFEPGVPRHFVMAWVALDTMTVRRDAQIYTALGAGNWSYAAADGSFSARIFVDPMGFVVDYEGLFERL